MIGSGVCRHIFALFARMDFINHVHIMAHCPWVIVTKISTFIMATSCWWRKFWVWERTYSTLSFASTTWNPSTSWLLHLIGLDSRVCSMFYARLWLFNWWNTTAALIWRNTTCCWVWYFCVKCYPSTANLSSLTSFIQEIVIFFFMNFAIVIPFFRWKWLLDLLNDFLKRQFSITTPFYIS